MCAGGRRLLCPPALVVYIHSTQDFEEKKSIMPKYCIVTQNDLKSSDPHRHVRGANPRQQSEIIVHGTNPINALRAAEHSNALPVIGELHGLPIHARVVSIEEISAFDPFSITDEMIDQALLIDSAAGTDGMAMERELYEDNETPMLKSDALAFLSAVREVADRLRESDLVPQLNISLVAAPEEPIDYIMVEIYEPTTARYYSTGCEVRHVTDDRSATGWDEIRAIARGLIHHAAPLM